MDEDETSRRIEELETKLTYQERTMTEMSAAAFEHERRIQRLESLLRQMAEKLKELAGEGPPLPPGERPPHY